MYVDDAPGLTPRRSQLTLPSWNTRDVMRGVTARAPSTYPNAFPLAVRRLAVGQTLDLPVLRGWATTFVEVTPPAGAPQLVELAAPGGGPVSPSVRLAIVRTH